MIHDTSMLLHLLRRTQDISKLQSVSVPINSSHDEDNPLFITVPGETSSDPASRSTTSNNCLTVKKFAALVEGLKRVVVSQSYTVS